MAGNKGQGKLIIYSNDGAERLSENYIGETPAVLTIAIVNDGLVCEYYNQYDNIFYNSKEYTYLGEKVFKGFATAANATEPTYAIGDTFLHSPQNKDSYAPLYLYIVEADITFDLSTLGLPAGTHNITVKARASLYTDSAESNAVDYTVEEKENEMGIVGEE